MIGSLSHWFLVFWGLGLGHTNGFNIWLVLDLIDSEIMEDKFHLEFKKLQIFFQRSNNHAQLIEFNWSLVMITDIILRGETNPCKVAAYLTGTFYYRLWKHAG